MLKEASAVNQSNHFNLKNEFVELINIRRESIRAYMTIEELEAMRTQRPFTPASKHSLEVICGASCETGAQ